MKIRKTLLRTLARRWPSSFGKDHYKYQVDSDTYHNRYFWDRYRQITQQGLPVNFHGRRVLDLGCGEGATSHFLARNYASVVVGIDIFFDPQAVLHEAYRVLAVGGFLNIPIFSSILSKYGAHMKTYIKLP
ncbi:MAG: hypothetical protein QGH20_02525, partial [Candidatus Latescibacteria bacterium]|nr:hypothetical protein [Candidatus Latescibacterota bacterium]